MPDNPGKISYKNNLLINKLFMIISMYKFKNIVFASAILSGISFSSCHSSTKDQPPAASVNTDSTAGTRPAAPVEVATDDSLKMGIKDAVKDYPGVSATTDNGEITLTGNIDRSRLSNLMMSLNSLHPKKINNNLTVK